jgi:hypothetical protein
MREEAIFRIPTFEKIIFKNTNNQAHCQVMIQVAYPTPEFRVRRQNEKEQLFDPIRKKWIVITPEEWVRQNFIQYLVKTMHYPPVCFAVEKSLQVGELRCRADIVVFKNQIPWMLIECKEPGISLNESTLQQLLGYKSVVPCSYLVATNGNQTLGFEIDSSGSAIPIRILPIYS